MQFFSGGGGGGGGLKGVLWDCASGELENRGSKGVKLPVTIGHFGKYHNTLCPPPPHCYLCSFYCSFGQS